MLRRSSLYTLVVAFAIFCFGVNAEAANFAGTWNFNLVGTKDQCGLGLKGKKVPISGVVITQSGKKATLTLQGITYKAKVTGKSMKGSGKYASGGMTISGTIVATLKGAKKMSIGNTKLTIKSGGKTCSVFLKGSGSKVA